jgi:hypothetical protein
MIDFEIARTWHTMFAQQMDLIAAGVVEKYPATENVCDDSRCELGKWLRKSGVVFSGLPAFSELTSAHRLFHGRACDVLQNAIGRKQGPSADEARVRVATSSADVLRLIDQLASEYLAANGSAAYRSLFEPDSTQPDESWDESLSIGIPALDEQHHAMARFLDKIESHQDQAVEAEFIGYQLIELGEIIDMHFTIEEAYIRNSAMPRQEMKWNRI